MRSVQARTVATRKRLVETAAAVLLERGYAGLSTNEVANRAGMARGTMLHHFPSRAALVSAAVEHLLEQRTEAVFAQLSTIEPAMSLRQVLHAVWPAFQDSTFATWAQLCVAAQTDRELAEQLVAVDRRFTESTRIGFAGIAQTFGAVDPAAADLVRDFLVALLVGLGFERMLPRERRDVDDYFGPAAEIAMAMLDAPRGASTLRSTGAVIASIVLMGGVTVACTGSDHEANRSTTVSLEASTSTTVPVDASTATTATAASTTSATVSVQTQSPLRDRPLPDPVPYAATASVALADPAFEAVPGATADFGQLGGAVYQLEVPDDWDGTLVMWMHGFGEFGPEARVGGPDFRRYLIGHGIAWAASSFSSTSMIPSLAADETAALWDHVVAEIGRPRWTYVSGFSMGGWATNIAAERYGDRYDGAFGLCGAVGVDPGTAHQRRPGRRGRLCRRTGPRRCGHQWRSRSAPR